VSDKTRPCPRSARFLFLFPSVRLSVTYYDARYVNPTTFNPSITPARTYRPSCACCGRPDDRYQTGRSLKSPCTGRTRISTSTRIRIRVHVYIAARSRLPSARVRLVWEIIVCPENNLDGLLLCNTLPHDFRRKRSSFRRCIPRSSVSLSVVAEQESTQECLFFWGGGAKIYIWSVHW
jgi:hypothetical protein